MRNQRGFTIIEAVIAAGISAAVILGSSMMFVDSAKMESGQEREFWIAARRIEFQGVIRSQLGWTAIVAANPTMACFANSTSCAFANSPQPLKLPIDGAVVDGTLATTGMSNKGDFCNAFDSTHGNSSCPVGLRLNWVALCDNSACLHAQPRLTVQFQVRETGSELKDLKSYDLVIFKDPKLETLNEICTSMGGTFIQPTCTIPALSGACDPSNALGLGATYPIAFDAAGRVQCGKPVPGACASTEVATGFDANGGLLCAPACL